MIIHNSFQKWLQRTQSLILTNSSKPRQKQQRNSRRPGIEQLEDRRVMTADVRSYDGTETTLSTSNGEARMSGFCASFRPIMRMEFLSNT